MKYHFKIHQEKKGYWAKCLELQGCVTQADSKESLAANMEEALNLYLDEPEDSKALYSLPNKRMKGRLVVEVPVKPSIAFAFLLRRARLMKKMTQREAAERLKMKNLYSYQRLEDGRISNPELATLSRVKTLFPQLSFDEIFS